jgi:hypothetical protein
MRDALAVDEFGNVAGNGGAGNVAHLRPQPGGRARGLYDPNATYFAMDVVAHNGSEWRAVVDNPGALPGPGWMLGAKGSRGRPGEPGKPGVHVRAMSVVGYCLVLELSNGQTLRANLLPVLELFARESGK